MRLSEEQMIEALAEYAHNAWAGWTQWMFDKWNATHQSGEPFQDRWRRQIATPYRDLSEQEKESDRKEAREMLSVAQIPELLADLAECREQLRKAEMAVFDLESGLASCEKDYAKCKRELAEMSQRRANLRSYADDMERQLAEMRQRCEAAERERDNYKMRAEAAEWRNAQCNDELQRLRHDLGIAERDTLQGQVDALADFVQLVERWADNRRHLLDCASLQDTAASRLKNLPAESKARQERYEAMREALEWYGDWDNYRTVETSSGLMPLPVSLDMGQRAREALGVKE